MQSVAMMEKLHAFAQKEAPALCGACNFGATYFLICTNIFSNLTNIFCDLQIYVFKQIKIACFPPERGPAQVWWVKAQLAKFSNKWFHFFINQLLAMSGQPN